MRPTEVVIVFRSFVMVVVDREVLIPEIGSALRLRLLFFCSINHDQRIQNAQLLDPLGVSDQGSNELTVLGIRGIRAPHMVTPRRLMPRFPRSKILQPTPLTLLVLVWTDHLHARAATNHCREDRSTTVSVWWSRAIGRVADDEADHGLAW
jgi:hypothetical protein